MVRGPGHGRMGFLNSMLLALRGRLFLKKCVLGLSYFLRDVFVFLSFCWSKLTIWGHFGIKHEHFRSLPDHPSKF